MSKKLPLKTVRKWWPISQNDNDGGLPESFPNYWCRGWLAACCYLLPQAVTGALGWWYYRALQQTAVTAGIAPVDAQFAGLIVGVLILAVGTFTGIMCALWVLMGRSRVLKYVCREML